MIYSVHGIPVGAVTTRQQVEGEIRIGTTLMILFSPCFWTVRVELQEPEPIGEREGRVFRTLLDDPSLASESGAGVDPYERRWDGLLPLEKDPLSRLRVLIQGIVSTMQFGPITNALDPFTGDL